jgi:hypothetical protein
MSDELSEAMGRLHEELAQHPHLDASTVASLKALASDIQRLIDQQTGEQPSSSNTSILSSRIQEYVDEFEVNHPQLTKTLSMIAERLADMGI